MRIFLSKLVDIGQVHNCHMLTGALLLIGLFESMYYKGRVMIIKGPSAIDIV